MNRTKTTTLLASVSILIVAGLLSGCIAVSAAKAGLSVGNAAAKTTVGVAGAAAGAAGSAAHATVSDDESPTAEE